MVRPMSRRAAHTALGVRYAGLAFACALASAPAMAQQDAPAAANAGVYDLLVGTYTAGKSHGIYVYRFDASNGQVTPLSSVQTVNPSYLVVTRDHRRVYAVNELPGDNGPATERGGISAFTFDPRAGTLSFVNRVSSEGNDPCYLSFSPDERYLLTANYSVAADPGGSFAVFPLQASGGVGDAVLVVHHEGGGPVKGRQDDAHVHSTVFAPDGRYLFAQDLGNDKLYEYRYTNDGSRGLISPVPEGYTQMPPGSGPRHLIFDAAGHYAYLTSELAGTVTTLQYANGKLRPLQVVRLTAPGFKGKIGAGAIHLSPDGKFLYATNRGDVNEIVVFSVDPYDGLLKLVGRYSTLGRTPREFAIDPTGRWLIVGNQDSDSAFIFRRDPETGRLAEPAQLSIGSPVDFAFTPSS
ncbi:lactonase family protein [Trinickia sp. NRRL B-1857]|uniref:lactonase family protein n=1 Tax=Trinickia sp. NRRL B-1857 TaxID=3162879 RepID=UPI003D26DD2A